MGEWDVKPPATVLKVVHYKDLKSALVDAQVRAYVRDLMPRLERECRRGPVTAGSLFEALMGEEMATINTRLNNNILNGDRNAATVPPWKMFALFAGHFWDCRTTHSTKFELDCLRSYIETNHEEAAACVLTEAEHKFLLKHLTMVGPAQQAPVSATWTYRIDPFREQQDLVGRIFRKSFILFACGVPAWFTLDDWHIGSRSKYLIKKMKKTKAECWGFTLDVIVVSGFKIPVFVRQQEKQYNQDAAILDMFKEIKILSGQRANVVGMVVFGDQGYTRGQVPRHITEIGAGYVIAPTPTPARTCMPLK